MSNVIKGTITCEIDGERLELLLATNEWCELEDELGKNTQQILSEFFAMAQIGALNMRLMRSLFRAALSQVKPGISLIQAGEIMSRIGLVEAAPLLGKVILASMPNQDDGGDEGKPLAPRPPHPRR